MGEQQRIKAALLGLGTVGAGVVKTLLQNGTLIKERTGYEIEIPYILVRNPFKQRTVSVPPETIVTDPETFLTDEEVSLVIEVMGGVEPARQIILRSLRAGKHVVTANKELLAKHGAELFKAAHDSGVQLLFEASVAGGIPVIRTVQSYMTANRVHEITGILNGTSNYILTQMEQHGLSFAEALLQAQQLGYAEADPASDVEGYDTAYKLAILTNLAHDINLPVEQMTVRGISQIDSQDLQLARQFGYAIKLLGRSRQTEEGVSFTVGPYLLPLSHPLADIQDAFNAVTISGDVVGDLTLIGKGAGEFPTASAVVEDVTALLRQTGQVLRQPVWTETAAEYRSESMTKTHYLRLHASIQVRDLVDRLIDDAAENNGAKILHKKGIVNQTEAIMSYIIHGWSTEEMTHWIREIGRDNPVCETKAVLPVWEAADHSQAKTFHIGWQSSEATIGQSVSIG